MFIRLVFFATAILRVDSKSSSNSFFDEVVSCNSCKSLMKCSDLECVEVYLEGEGYEFSFEKRGEDYIQILEPPQYRGKVKVSDISKSFLKECSACFDSASSSEDMSSYLENSWVMDDLSCEQCQDLNKCYTVSCVKNYFGESDSSDSETAGEEQQTHDAGNSWSYYWSMYQEFKAVCQEKQCFSSSEGGANKHSAASKSNIVVGTVSLVVLAMGLSALWFFCWRGREVKNDDTSPASHQELEELKEEDDQNEEEGEEEGDGFGRKK